MKSLATMSSGNCCKLVASNRLPFRRRQLVHLLAAASVTTWEAVLAVLVASVTPLSASVSSEPVSVLV
jgi:hypothetical protein